MNSFWIGLLVGIIIGIIGTILFAVIYVSSENRDLEEFDFTLLTDEEKEKLKTIYDKEEE